MHALQLGPSAPSLAFSKSGVKAAVKIPTALMLTLSAAILIAATVALALVSPTLAVNLFALFMTCVVGFGMSVMGIGWIVVPVLVTLSLIVTVGGLGILALQKRAQRDAA